MTTPTAAQRRVRVTVSLPRAMYERFLHERTGYGARTVKEVIEHKLRFWEGRWEDRAAVPAPATRGRRGSTPQARP